MAATRSASAPSSQPRARRSTSSLGKLVNLALQGGGAHGAFTWGILDALLEDGRLHFEAISATSAGSLNAVLLAQGLRNNNRDEARAVLEDFWHDLSRIGSLQGVFGLAWLAPHHWAPFAVTPLCWGGEILLQAMSPYQLNPLNINPFADLLRQHVDFEKLRTTPGLQLYLCATNVETGKIRIFERSELALEVVLASACLPQIFQAVEIAGEYYWDGGYLGDPAIYPLIYNCHSADVIIAHINPITRRGVPRTAMEITNRVNEISFNSSLMREMRAIAFVTQLIESGKVKKDEMKLMRIHSIRADNYLNRYGVASKLDLDWAFLCELREAGRNGALRWLEENFAQIGKKSTTDIRKDYL